MRTEYEQALLDTLGAMPRDARSLKFNDWQKQYELRASLSRRFAFAILTGEVLEALKPYGPYLEVGAGTGYWAYEMRKAGIDIIATDLAPGENYEFEKRWPGVEAMSAEEALATYDYGKGRTLLTVWPCYNEPWINQALRKFRGDRVVYVGEGMYGCTGDAAFHRRLARDWDLEERIHIPSWWYIGDHVYVYRRKENRS